MTTKKRIETHNWTEGKRKFYKVMVYYQFGGMNYWNYKQEPRGYGISIKRVTGTPSIYTYSPMDKDQSLRLFLFETKRFSRKQLENIYNQLQPMLDSVYTDLENGTSINDVMERLNTQLRARYY